MPQKISTTSTHAGAERAAQVPAQRTRSRSPFIREGIDLYSSVTATTCRASASTSATPLPSVAGSSDALIEIAHTRVRLYNLSRSWPRALSPGPLGLLLALHRAAIRAQTPAELCRTHDHPNFRSAHSITARARSLSVSASRHAVGPVFEGAFLATWTSSRARHHIKAQTGASLQGRRRADLHRNLIEPPGRGLSYEVSRRWRLRGARWL